MHSMNDLEMSAICKGVLMENLEACMQQGVATTRTAIGAGCIADVPTGEGCATTPGKRIVWRLGCPHTR